MNFQGFVGVNHDVGDLFFILLQFSTMVKTNVMCRVYETRQLVNQYYFGSKLLSQSKLLLTLSHGTNSLN